MPQLIIIVVLQEPQRPQRRDRLGWLRPATGLLLAALAYAARNWPF